MALGADTGGRGGRLGRVEQGRDEAEGAAALGNNDQREDAQFRRGTNWMAVCAGRESVLVGNAPLRH